jgi:hypothetical protein
MRWIVEKPEFTRIFLEARTCVYIDSGREPTLLRRMVFDDAGMVTPDFAKMLQRLMGWSEEPVCNYVVLDPDPVHYFHRQFGKYPVVEIAYGDSPQDYLKFLNQDPGGSPVDAIGTNCWAWVVVPPSIRWFVHALRSDESDSGHLWVPQDWFQRIREVCPWVFVAP